MEDSFTFDFTKPKSANSTVKLHLDLDKLFEAFNEKQKHSLLLLAGDLYDPFTNSITLTSKAEELEQTSNLEYDRHQNIMKLANQLNLLLKNAKVQLFLITGE